MIRILGTVTGDRLVESAKRRTTPATMALSGDFMDWQFIDGIFSKLPARFHAPISDSYRNRYRELGQQAANVELQRLGATVTVMGADLSASDSEICSRAKKSAGDVAAILAGIGNGNSFMMLDRLRRYCTGQGAALPEGVGLQGAIARMVDAAWWRRQYRRTAGRQVEGFARKMGMVQRAAGIYASDETVDRHQEQKARSLAAMQNTEAVNNEGEVFNLAELAALGVSNPSVRFAELMVRVRGMESHARAAGHVGVFCTGTVPGEMHAIKASTGKQNRLFDDTAPREAQQWICRQWARIRAALARLGVKYYGVRVAEPHHDGTPHWHMLVFVRPELSPGRSAVSRFMAVFRRYLLRGDWKKTPIAEFRARGLGGRAAKAAAQSERVEQRAKEKANSARRRRVCDFKLIDWARGSAAGYLVKYLAKNISGERMGADNENGKPATETAGRVLAWASCWGIRQFQVVGGPPVGVWRELRRIKEKPEQLELFAAWSATGSKDEERAPDWGAYIAAQGGIDCARADRPVQVWRLQEPGRLTKYRDEAPARVAGVLCGGVATSTRETVWTIRAKNEAAPVAGQGRAVAQRGNSRRPGRFAFGFAVAPSAPRTRVNNCTQRTKTGMAGLVANMAGHWSAGNKEQVLEIFNELRRLKNVEFRS